MTLGDSFEAGQAELSQIFEAYQIVETGINVEPVSKLPLFFFLTITGKR